MKTPKFTDLHKRPHGYVPAVATDIRETFKRVTAPPKPAIPIGRKRGQS